MAVTLSIIAFHVSDIVSQHHSVLRQNGSYIVEKLGQLGVAREKLFLLSFQLPDIEIVDMQRAGHLREVLAC
ncbi:hypothetical protein [Rhizobium leguminosarum]|uniref:hypothetical protein n=1 Tax=Rhizobium leguminosarum TaxID=384 RepID=UPI003F9E5CD2